MQISLQLLAVLILLASSILLASYFLQKLKLEDDGFLQLSIPRVYILFQDASGNVFLQNKQSLVLPGKNVLF